jgi:hypothetical protein
VAPKVWRDWVDDLIGAIKSFLIRRFGIQAGLVTPAQLRSLAVHALRDSLRRAAPAPREKNGRRTGEKQGETRATEDPTYSIRTPKDVSAAATGFLKGTREDVRSPILGAVPLNYLVDQAEEGQTAIADYIDHKRQMDAYRGKRQHMADRQIDDWRKVGKSDPKAGVEVADLMHETTLVETDPSKTTATEAKRPLYRELRARFLALPAGFQKLYVDVRDAYKEQTRELDNVILENIRKNLEQGVEAAEKRYRATMRAIRVEGLTGAEKAEAEARAHMDRVNNVLKGKYRNKALLGRMRKSFEANRIRGPYFPLGRFGEYFVTARERAADGGPGKLVSFSRFEKEWERATFIKALRAAEPDLIISTGVLSNRNEVRGAMSAMDPRVVGEITDMLKNSGVEAEVLDAIWQRYLMTLPDISIRKRYIHRKGTTGFHKDALRTFGSHMFHASHQMARLKYSPELNLDVEHASEQAESAPNPVKAGKVANELRLRHQWVLHPHRGRVAVGLTQLGFAWYLAATPASAMVNLTQTPMVAYPALGSRFGYGKALSALTGAMKDFVGGKGSLVDGTNLSAEESAAMEMLYDAGALDRSRAMDLAGVAEEGKDYWPIRTRVMNAIAWMFHKAETANREITALAGFRLARGAGQSVDEAVKTAGHITWLAHFDYSTANRPRYLQNDAARVAFLFRQFTINMWYRLGRDFNQSFKGATPQLRREARHQFAGIMTMMMFYAGALGLPAANVLLWLVDLIRGFLDPEDPRSTEIMLRQGAESTVGKTITGLVFDGVPGTLAGVSLTDRIGMADIWFRSDDRDVDLKEWWTTIGNEVLGPVFGIGESVVRGIVAAQDDPYRGIETAMPKAVKDQFKAWRYLTEGATSMRGDTISEPSVGDAIRQSLGFFPQELSHRYRLNTEVKNIEGRILDERQRLLGELYQARLNRDRDATSAAIDDIKAFNKIPINRGARINGETIERSFKARQSTTRRADFGIIVTDPELGRDINRLLDRGAP